MIVGWLINVFITVVLMATGCGRRLVVLSLHALAKQHCALIFLINQGVVFDDTHRIILSVNVIRVLCVLCKERRKAIVIVSGENESGRSMCWWRLFLPKIGNCCAYFASLWNSHPNWVITQ